MKIGTFSSERRGDKMATPGKIRLDALLRAIDQKRPDLLLTAGYAVETDDDMAELHDRLTSMDWDGVLFVEVRDSRKLPWQLDIEGWSYELYGHCLYAWSRNGGAQALGRQSFVSSADAQSKLAALEVGLAERDILFRDQRVGALICGEINVLRGTDPVRCRSQATADWMKDLAIMVNPTHDRMGRDGILDAKRRFISQTMRGGNGIYISASNWNSEARRPQSQHAELLHTVYAAGKRLTLLPYSFQQHVGRKAYDFEYREVSM